MAKDIDGVTQARCAGSQDVEGPHTINTTSLHAEHDANVASSWNNSGAL